ncbi:HtaA domain-containing protein [Nocardioides sp. SR21]|uniref:HtaA domain-containing protein n=1 Tax=Nocardioides sp. SR21 TaxID=2919501 RepID=UPI001FAA2D6B|nr:HtaA domain-containing protein [Nocardioides sp. SR21]
MTLARRVAAVAALSLASTGLVGVAAQPASAAELSFTWEISQQLDDHLSTHALTGGATEDSSGVITFPGGEGSFDPETGAGTVQYDGAVAASFQTFYEVKIAEPAVTIDEQGNGEITAVVSGWDAPSGGPAAGTTPTRVIVTTFDAAGGWGDGSLAATPDWAGVLPSGAESQALGITAGQPVDGKSFAPTFLGQITSGVRAHFYASGSGSDPKKAPASFTAQAEPGEVAEPTPAVEVETTYDGHRALIAVDGTGFAAVTNPGDAGVYVALAEAGDFPETDDFEDQEKVADAEWVTPAQMADGTFSVTLNPENQYLNPSKQYAVYTWQAHAHSNPSQDTETAVEIVWAELAVPATLGVKVAKAPTPKKAGSLKVTVTGADTPAKGKVTVVLTKKGQKAKNLTGKVANGAGTVKLPKLVKGTWKLKVQFLPSDAAYTSVTKTQNLKVK